MTTPLILLTNDDGFYAPGIKALEATLAQVGEVMVVAPDRQRSGVGRAITLRRPLRARGRGPGRWAVDGTPTYCVYLALHHLLDQRPDLVVSGINSGPNLADDVFYSGTVAGAMEAASVGVPAMAVSLVGHPPTDYEPAAAFASLVARWLLARPLPEGTVLNVNVPETQGAAVPGYRWTRGGRRDYRHQVTVQSDPWGTQHYWLGGPLLYHFPVAGSDCEAIDAGLAALTPLSRDLTDHGALAQLEQVRLEEIEGR